MFTKNKYYNIYYNIIDRAKSRVFPDVYSEKHHIVPKSLGGSNDDENIVKLTAKEHFICHLLLTKITSGKNKAKMVFAIMRLVRSKNNTYAKKINGKKYEKLKLAWSNSQKLLWKDPKYKKNQKEKRVHYYSDPKWKNKLSQIQKKIHEEHPEIGAKKSLPGTMNGMYGKTHSEKTKIILANHCKKRFENKSYEEIYGTTKAIELKEDRSKKIKDFIKRNPDARSGSNNPNSKTYIITDSTGNIFHVKCLKDFCKNNNLSYGMMGSLARGKSKEYKGYKIIIS